MAFDVFSEDGEFDSVVALRGRMDPVHDRAYPLSASMVLVVRGADVAISSAYGIEGFADYAQKPEVICYRMVARGGS